MVLIIKLQDNKLYEYDSYKNIPYDINPLIVSLKCNNCELDNIDFISLFPNLKKINASNNKITMIPIISNIEELEIYYNELIELPPLPNLKKLYAFNNKLKSIPLYPKLEIIDVSNNNISKILLGENINTVDISYNQLTNIEFQGNDVLELDCSNNLLTDVNFIHGLNKINNIYFEYNPLEILPIHIIRYLWDPLNIYNSDKYHNLDKTTVKKILKVVNLFNNIKTDAYNVIINNLYKNKIITLYVVDLLEQYVNINTMEPTIKLTYLELFICYMNYIMLNDTDKYKKLNYILLMKTCTCISCLFKNLSTIL